LLAQIDEVNFEINSFVLATIVSVVLDTWADHDLKSPGKTIHSMCMIKTVKYTSINKATVYSLCFAYQQIIAAFEGSGAHVIRSIYI
jgi:hypothetical protein